VKEGFHVQQKFLGWCLPTVRLSIDRPFSTDALGNPEATLCRQSIAALRVGQYNRALELAQTVLWSCPAHPLPSYLQALSLAYLKGFDEAEHAIRMVLAARPDSMDARFLQDGIFIMYRPPTRHEYPCSLDVDGNLRSEVRRAATYTPFHSASFQHSIRRTGCISVSQALFQTCSVPFVDISMRIHERQIQTEV
jgi:hypothetical protein